MRMLAMPAGAERWSLTSLREKLIKIGAKGGAPQSLCYVQLAEVAVPRHLFCDILSLTARLRPRFCEREETEGTRDGARSWNRAEPKKGAKNPENFTYVAASLHLAHDRHDPCVFKPLIRHEISRLALNLLGTKVAKGLAYGVRNSSRDLGNVR